LAPKLLLVIAGIAAIGIVVAIVASSASISSSPSTESIGTGITNAAGPRPVFFQAYQEPTVGAFALLIPSGWTANSALVPHYATFNPQIFLQVADPTGTRSITYQEYSIPDFTDPSADTFGRPEGSWFVEGFNLSFRYLTADQYAQSFMIKELEKSLDNVQLQSVFPVTDPWRTDASQGTSIADAIYSATRDGSNYEIGTTIFTTPTGGGLIWSSSYYIFSAPQGELDELLQVYSVIAPTYKPNTSFLLSRIQQAGVVSGITARTSEEIRSIYGQAFANAQASQSRIGEKMSDAILGTMDVADPQTGDRFTVSNDFQFWWVDGLGNVVATNTPGSPDPQRNLTLLQPVNN
jgi:hypothetical protein